MRTCGSCKECCTAVGVVELGKPFNAPCEHLCKLGCSIYGAHPDSCKVYQCFWRAGEFTWMERPDLLGAVFHLTEDDGLWIDVLLTKPNVNPGKLAALAELLLAKYPDFKGARFVRSDQVLNSEFPIDLEKYPGFEPIGTGSEWYTHDGCFLYLKAPKRLPLKVLQTD